MITDEQALKLLVREWKRNFITEKIGKLLDKVRQEEVREQGLQRKREGD